MIRARIIGCGTCLPDNVVSNDELAKRVDTSDAWIRERTGITQPNPITAKNSACMLQCNVCTTSPSSNPIFPP